MGGMLPIWLVEGVTPIAIATSRGGFPRMPTPDSISPIFHVRVLSVLLKNIFSDEGRCIPRNRAYGGKNAVSFVPLILLVVFVTVRTMAYAVSAPPCGGIGPTLPKGFS